MIQFPRSNLCPLIHLVYVEVLEEILQPAQLATRCNAAEYKIRTNISNMQCINLLLPNQLCTHYSTRRESFCLRRTKHMFKKNQTYVKQNRITIFSFSMTFINFILFCNIINYVTNVKTKKYDGSSINSSQIYNPKLGYYPCTMRREASRNQNIKNLKRQSCLIFCSIFFLMLIL